MRIGSALPRPTEFRHLSTWLGHDDLLQLMMRCIEAPEIGYLVVWGVSANTRSYWDNAGAERLGYRPTQNAEDYAEEILSRPNPLDATAQRYQGGGFVTQDFTPWIGGPGDDRACPLSTREKLKTVSTRRWRPASSSAACATSSSRTCTRSTRRLARWSARPSRCATSRRARTSTRSTVFQDPAHPQRKAVEECPPGAVFVIDSRKDAARRRRPARSWSPG